MLFSSARRLLFVILFSSSSLINIQAQESRDTTELESVVIVASKLKRPDLEGLKRGTTPSFLAILDQIPGLVRAQENNYPIVYRGMYGDNLRIEYNGAFRNGINTSGYVGNDINPDDIGTFKIIEGADRALFGSGANGGVISIESVDPRVLINNKVFLGYGMNNDSKVTGGRLNFGKGGWGGTISGRNTSTSNFKYANQETAANSSIEQTNIGFSTFLDSLGSFDLTWNNNFSTGTWERPQGFQNLPNELRKLKTKFQYQTNLKLNWGIKKQFSGNVWAFVQEAEQNRDNYNFSFETINQNEFREFDKFSLGYRFTGKGYSEGGVKHIYGSDLIFSKLQESRIRRNFLDNTVDENPKSVVRQELRLGVFYKLEKSLNELDWAVSIRSDFGRIGSQNRIRNFNVTGAIELNWRVNSSLISDWTLGRYFRFPNQLETSGDLVGGRGVFTGNPDLTPETSYQLDWKVTGNFGELNYGISTWLGLFHNRIVEALVSPGQFTYENRDKSRTYGLEAEFIYRMLSISMDDQILFIHRTSLVRGDDISDSGFFDGGTPLIGIPPGRFNFGLQYRKTFNSKLVMRLDGNYRYSLSFSRLPAETIRQIWGVSPAQAYGLVDLKLEFQLKTKQGNMQFGVAADNLLDTGYFPFGARIMGMGRNIRPFLRVYF